MWLPLKPGDVNGESSAHLETTMILCVLLKVADVQTSSLMSNSSHLHGCSPQKEGQLKV